MPGGIRAGSSRPSPDLAQLLRLRAGPHHPPKPGQPAAGVGQVRRPGARPGPGLGAIGQNGGQQLGRIIGRGSRHWRMRLPLRVPDGGQGTAAGNQPEYRATWPTGVYAAGMQQECSRNAEHRRSEIELPSITFNGDLFAWLLCLGSHAWAKRLRTSTARRQKTAPTQ
jgi:hypothetical protein